MERNTLTQIESLLASLLRTADQGSGTRTRVMAFNPGDRQTSSDTTILCGVDDELIEVRSNGLARTVSADPSIDDASAAAMIGRRIGHYRIKRLIASGGMGHVFLAEQECPSRDVALKVIRPDFADHSFVQRFIRESEILGNLVHPHIAHVYEAGMHEFESSDPVFSDYAPLVPFFAMEHVRDATALALFAEKRRLTVRQRIHLFLDVCSAVAHGHAHHVIHCDLKPENILVDGDGCVKVIDFGLARWTDPEHRSASLTRAGYFLGTAQYMSPEQCQVDREHLDHRCDIYALGLVLYELLTGALPYEVPPHCQVMSAMRIVCKSEPQRPSKINRLVRGDLEAITLKALQKQPDDRFQSVREFSDDLRRWLSGRPVRGAALTWRRRLLMFLASQRRRFWSTIVVFVAAATLAR